MTPKKAKSKASTPAKKTVTLTLPVFETNGYISRHLDFQMTRGQAIAYRRVLDGLRAEHALLASGKHVDAAPDAIRWMLEQVYQQLYGDAPPASVEG